MIAIDTNLLVYAHVEAAPHHSRASALLRDLAASGNPWAIPAHCLAEFFAISTHPRIYRPPSTALEAFTQVRAWIKSPTMTLLNETAETWTLVQEIARGLNLFGPAIYDARIAALCIQHDVAELWTCDRDFTRFPQLRTRNPFTDPLPTRAGESRVRYRVERRGRPAASAR